MFIELFNVHSKIYYEYIIDFNHRVVRVVLLLPDLQSLNIWKRCEQKCHAKSGEDVGEKEKHYFSSIKDYYYNTPSRVCHVCYACCVDAKELLNIYQHAWFSEFEYFGHL